MGLDGGTIGAGWVSDCRVAVVGSEHGGRSDTAGGGMRLRSDENDPEWVPE